MGLRVVSDDGMEDNLLDSGVFRNPLWLARSFFFCFVPYFVAFRGGKLRIRCLLRHNSVAKLD